MMRSANSMKRACLALCLAVMLAIAQAAGIGAGVAAAAAAAIHEGAPTPQSNESNDATVETEALRGGGYRSPSGSFSGGTRNGVSPGGTYRTGPRAPSSDVSRNPRYTTPGGGTGGYTPGRTGTFLGGLAAGALLGHLFNPFAGFGWGSGYGGGYGFSIISLLIWAVILYAAYRFIRRIFQGPGGRGPYR